MEISVKTVGSAPWQSRLSKGMKTKMKIKKSEKPVASALGKTRLS